MVHEHRRALDHGLDVRERVHGLISATRAELIDDEERRRKRDGAHQLRHHQPWLGRQIVVFLSICKITM
jgi:hypothetical protein